MLLEELGIQASNSPITRRRALPPELQRTMTHAYLRAGVIVHFRLTQLLFLGTLMMH